MNKTIMTLFTRTPLHVGAGASVGAIDQPIIRERHTSHPIIPGSSIKGVLRDACRRDAANAPSEDAIFGVQDNAGTISFGEAKILAFPVRSAKGSFAFVVCPLTLERLRRECPDLPTVPAEPGEMHCLSGASVSIKRGGQAGVILEEYRFEIDGDFPKEWEDKLLALLDDPVWQTASKRLVLLSNGDFTHFVKNACEVSQHVGIDPSKGTAKKGALFNLEAVPSETLFFAPLTGLSRQTTELDSLKTLLNGMPLVQFGGDSTTGLGFCTVKIAQEGVK